MIETRCIDLTEDAGEPWFACHRILHAGETSYSWKAYGRSLFAARIKVWIAQHTSKGEPW
jgi:hypothetical protein